MADLVGIAACAVIIMDSEKNRKRRRWWKRERFAEGPRFGCNLLSTLQLEDSMGFRNFTRLTPSDFEELLQLLGGKIKKQENRFREIIPPSLRLAVTLRYLASGESFTSLMYTFRISKQAVSQIVREVCEAIIQSLKGFVKVCINIHKLITDKQTFIFMN